MVRDQTQSEQGSGPGGENGEGPPGRYYIDLELAGTRHRSLPLMVAGRRCYACNQSDDEDLQSASALKSNMERIAEHCAHTPDYLPADTPLKEGAFRVILAGGNQPMTAEEISQILGEKWEMTPFPRDLSPSVLRKLLDSSQSYCIERMPDPVAPQSDDDEEASADTDAEPSTAPSSDDAG